VSQFVLVVASRAITEYMLAVLAIFFTPPARASDRSGFRAKIVSCLLVASYEITKFMLVVLRDFAPPAHASDRSAGFAPHCFLSARLPVVRPCEIAEFVPVVPAWT
jgi:hypothetical protein